MTTLSAIRLGLEALTRAVATEFEKYVKLNKSVPQEALVSVSQIEEASKLADTIAGHLSVKIEEKQKVLELTDVNERLEQIFGLMKGEISVLQVEKKIKRRVKSQMERTQREYYLNEQMKAIQRELGEGEDGREDVAELERKIEETELTEEAQAEGRGGAEEAQADGADVRRGDGRAQLSRLAARHSRGASVRRSRPI